MKKQLFKNLLIGALLPLGIQAQETAQANLLRDVKYKATVETQCNVAYLNNKYGVDIDSNHVLYKIIQEKNLKLGLALANYKNTDAENKHITEIFSNYEEQSAKHLRPLAALGYIKSQTILLDSIKPLPAEQKADLNNLFLNRTKYSDKNYDDILKAVLNEVTTDTTYYAVLFRKDIDKKAKELASNYTIKRQLPARLLTTAGKQVYQYQRALLVVDYAMPKGSLEKEKLVNAIETQYRALIDSALISMGVNLPGTRLVGLALEKSKALKLNEQQIIQLTSVCIAINRQKTAFNLANTGGKYDSRSYEYEQLPKILNDEQYNTLLAIKFKKQAFDDAEEKWKQIQKAGLVGIDADRQKGQIQAYYLSRMIAKEKFASAKDLQSAQIKSIDGTKPQILKKLDILQKEPSQKENLKSALLW